MSRNPVYVTQVYSHPLRFLFERDFILEVLSRVFAQLYQLKHVK